MAASPQIGEQKISGLYSSLFVCLFAFVTPNNCQVPDTFLPTILRKPRGRVLLTFIRRGNPFPKTESAPHLSCQNLLILEAMHAFKNPCISNIFSMVKNWKEVYHMAGIQLKLGVFLITVLSENQIRNNKSLLKLSKVFFHLHTANLAALGQQLGHYWWKSAFLPCVLCLQRGKICFKWKEYELNSI